MHLAVCDDNIADRKQAERLLGRESDRRLSTTGVLYVDSFGNKNAILTTPMIYDGIFMDMTEEGCDAVAIANTLREAGNALPIVFCCSKINYRQSPNLPDNCFFLDKPLQPAALAQMCDTLLEIKNSQVKKFEFRTDTELFYLEEAQIMYAFQDGRTVHVHLVDGSNREPVIHIINFCANLGFDMDDPVKYSMQIEISDSGLLARVRGNAVVNLTQITHFGFSHLRMTDGTKIRITPSGRKTLMQAAEKLKQ